MLSREDSGFVMMFLVERLSGLVSRILALGEASADKMERLKVDLILHGEKLRRLEERISALEVYYS